MIGIYKITSPSGKVYIGQSVNIHNRFNKYLNINNSKGQRKLNNSFKKYGVENHIFEIIEECEFEQLNIRERYWQDYYDVLGKNGLNCVLTETNSKIRILSEEYKRKISKSKKGVWSGEKNPNFNNKLRLINNDHLLKFLKGNKWNVGRKHSDEAKNRMSMSNKGNKIGSRNGKSKLIIDIETGIFFECIREAAMAYGLNYSCLRSYLQGKVYNKTNLIYADNHPNP